MHADHYRALDSRTEFRQKIERSEFLGIAVPVADEAAFFAELDVISKHYFDATHHCWAFRFLADERSRSSDAGEPSGTAGRPILAAIDGAALYDTAVVVVRWFGGIKLGTGGLSRAYRDTAVKTLEHATIGDRYVYHRYSVLVPFDSLGVVYRLLDPPNVILRGETFGERNVFEIDVRLSMRDDFESGLRRSHIDTLE